VIINIKNGQGKRRLKRKRY